MDWPRATLAHEGPERGLPVFDGTACTGCGDCVQVCPSRCLIEMEGRAVPIVDAGGCLRCGLCVDACGDRAVSLSGNGDLAALSREDLVMDGTFPEEQEVGPSPGRVYRWATMGVEGKGTTGDALLGKRSSYLVEDKGD